MTNKTRISNLAIFGGDPAFKEKLHVGRPNIGDRGRLLQRINQILDTKWLSNDGPCVLELERRIADFVGVKHCIAICNATVALEIAIRALGMSGEVIIPSFTFIATAHALQWQEITPVFCDVDPRTHTLNPKRIAELITARTTGIIGVHIWGQPCDIDAIDEIGRRHGLKILYDAAHAFGCTYRGKMIGGFGNAEVFSFHATKFFNSFEGGAVTTDDDELARKVRLMKNFGFTNWDEVSCVGINGKMSEVAAAMGLTSLEDIDVFIETNRGNYECYRDGLAGIPGLKLLLWEKSERFNFQYIVAEIDPHITNINRDQLVQVLWAENIIARRYFYPGCHRMEPYHSRCPEAGLVLPETERLAERVLCLPTGTAVSSEQIAKICRIIRFATANGELISEKLSAADPYYRSARSAV